MEKFKTFLESLRTGENSILIDVVTNGYEAWLEGVVRYKGHDIVTDLPVDFPETRDLIPLDMYDAEEILLQTVEAWEKKAKGILTDEEIEIIVSNFPKAIFNETKALPISLAKSKRWKELRHMAKLLLSDRIDEIRKKKIKDEGGHRAKSLSDELKSKKKLVDPGIMKKQQRMKEGKMKFHDDQLKKMFAKEYNH